MFLSIIFLKLSLAVNGHYWTLSCLLCNKKQFSCNSVLLWRPIWPKRTQKCVYGATMFLSTILFKHPSAINRVLHINCGTSGVPMQHLCITAPKYGGLYRTFKDIRNTQFLSIFLVIRVQKWKIIDRLWCKLSALLKHVKLYDKLWISLSEAPFLIKPTARPLYFILIQPKYWHFCDEIKLLDSCRWKFECTQGEKHLASCATCKTGISTLSSRINEHPYWIKLCYFQSTYICAQIYYVKYHFKQSNNKWATLKKMCFVNWRFRSFVQYSLLSSIYFQPGYFHTDPSSRGGVHKMLACVCPRLHQSWSVQCGWWRSSRLRGLYFGSS